MKKKFLFESSWVIFFILLFIFLKLCVIGLYLVPSPSMLPGLIPGDRVIANKLAYGLNIPFVNSPILRWSTPKRGDIILFSFENNSDIYIKRVIGLPGDLITFHLGQVLINNTPLNLQPIPYAPSYENLNSYAEGLNLYKEYNNTLFEAPHAVYLSKEPERTFFESRRFLVPPGKLFVLGDNRDNSADSRVYGYVDMKDVYGKASFVLFSTTGESFFPQFRKERFFMSISLPFFLL